MPSNDEVLRKAIPESGSYVHPSEILFAKYIHQPWLMYIEKEFIKRQLVAHTISSRTKEHDSSHTARKKVLNLTALQVVKKTPALPLLCISFGSHNQQQACRTSGLELPRTPPGTVSQGPADHCCCL